MTENDTTPLVDPDSIYWRVNRESFLLLGGGAALLLQIAHPLVAAGVADHSQFRSQPIRRLYGTITSMRQIVYGDRATAIAVGQRIRRMHASVRGVLSEDTPAFPAGTPYQANDPALLLWVHATLVAMALNTYEAVLAPLSAADRERYYAESKKVGVVFGLKPEQLPADYTAFERYFDNMIEGPELAVTATTAELAEQIVHPPISWVPNIAGEVVAMGTAALLPAPVRALYGLRWSPRRQLACRVARRSLRGALAYMPDVLRAGRHARRGEWRFSQLAT
jgi:uncharacterized protein (DUF2236 family)